MSIRMLSMLGLAFALVALPACSKSDEGDGAGDSAAPETPTTSSDASGIPAGLFVDAAPAGAMPLIDAKSSAKQGDQITFEARVGGRKNSFVENRAVFFVTDAKILSCDQIHGDTCKTPWDYCCEPKDNLLMHMATVQVVDDAGAPLKVSLAHEHGLDELKTIVVTGTVQTLDAAGNMVVNAESLHVKAPAEG